MIPAESFNSFLDCATNLKLNALATSETEMFIQRSYEYCPRTVQDVESAFEALRKIFSPSTFSQFPQLVTKINELKDASIAQMQGVVSKQLLGQSSKERNVEGLGTAEESVGVLCDIQDPVHARLLDALTSWKFTCRRFPEDGHSAFRAIAAWLFFCCPSEEVRKRIQCVEKELKGSPLQGLPVEKFLQPAISAYQSFEKQRKLSKKQSDEVVEFLRFAAVSRVLKQVNEGSRSLNVEAKEAYIQRMCSMLGKPEGQGGEMEICCLMNLFQVPYEIISFKPTQEPAAPAVQSLTTFLKSGVASDLQGAFDTFQKIRFSGLARKVVEIMRLGSTPEAKQKATLLLQEVEKHLSTQRIGQVEVLQQKIQQLGKTALILGVGKNGSYCLLIQHR